MADTKEGLSEYTHKIEEAPLDRITTEEEQDNDARINAFTPEQQKKIIRRIDIRLVLTLGFMYCVSLMDRTNLGIAVVVCLLLPSPLSKYLEVPSLTTAYFATHRLEWALTSCSSARATPSSRSSSSYRMISPS